jgi:Amt family ammonium transporter
MSLAIGKVIDLTIGLRVAEDEEQEGLDLTQHAEAAYS